MSGLDATAARNQPYAPRGTNDVDAILKQDDADESLQRYKAQLLGAAAKGDRGDASDPQEPVWINDAVTGTTSRRWRGITTPLHRRSYGSTSRRLRGSPDCDFHTGGS